MQPEVAEDIVFLVGLTGVGKSTTLGTLQRTNLTVLPNRRELADAIIIPEVQRQLGEPVEPVTDRLTRFALTRRYREQHPGGVVHALRRLLEQSPKPGPLLFDNARGVDEVRAAVETFPTSRFVFLDAPYMVRLQRLVGRSDAFDQVGVAATRLENTAFVDQLLAVKGADALFDLYEVARIEAGGVSDQALLSAVQIIAAEHENYNADAALAYLQAHLNDTRLLHLDTSQLPVSDVVARLEAWL